MEFSDYLHKIVTSGRWKGNANVYPNKVPVNPLVTTPDWYGVEFFFFSSYSFIIIIYVYKFSMLADTFFFDTIFFGYAE